MPAGQKPSRIPDALNDVLLKVAQASCAAYGKITPAVVKAVMALLPFTNGTIRVYVCVFTVYNTARVCAFRVCCLHLLFLNWTVCGALLFRTLRCSVVSVLLRVFFVFARDGWIISKSRKMSVAFRENCISVVEKLKVAAKADSERYLAALKSGILRLLLSNFLFTLCWFCCRFFVAIVIVVCLLLQRPSSALFHVLCLYISQHADGFSLVYLLTWQIFLCLFLLGPHEPYKIPNKLQRAIHQVIQNRLEFQKLSNEKKCVCLFLLFEVLAYIRCLLDDWKCWLLDNSAKNIYFVDFLVCVFLLGGRSETWEIETGRCARRNTRMCPNCVSRCVCI